MLLAVLMLVNGCGGGDQLKVAAVSGVVKLDGVPLDAGTIIFTPEKGRAAKGKISSDGKFALGTYGLNDGAIIGTHKVSILSALKEEAFESDEVVESKIPVKYSSPVTSGIAFEVKPGSENEFTVSLTADEE